MGGQLVIKQGDIRLRQAVYVRRKKTSLLLRKLQINALVKIIPGYFAKLYHFLSLSPLLFSCFYNSYCLPYYLTIFIPDFKV